VPVIYHIALAADWANALRDGAYTTSTRGVSLAEQGFIHASAEHQVAFVANSYYAGVPGLLLLVIDAARLTAPLRYEDVPGSDEPFPHIYGPLNPDAVIATVALEAGPDGTFEFPPAARR
jgi:glutathione S-transferase